MREGGGQEEIWERGLERYHKPTRARMTGRFLSRGVVRKCSSSS